MAAGAVEDLEVLAVERVRVTLLGPFRIKLDERSAGPWYRPAAKRLCELVMLAPSHRLGRGEARDLLFPKLAPARSANALSRALSLAREALAIREKALGSEHPDVAKSLNQLAALYHGQSKYSLAEPLYQRALEIRQRALGADHIDVAESLNNLAYLYNALGKYARAEPLYQQALSFCEKHLGAHHMYTAGSLANLAEVYRARGEYTQAEQLHRQALHIREQTLGSNHPSCGKSLNWLAEIYLCQHSYQVSETLALQALEIWQKTVGQEHNYVAIGLDTLARLRRAQGSPGVAEPLVVRALAIFAQQKEELEAGQCLYHRDQWCEATILADLGAIRLRFGMSSQHILEGIQCLSLAYEIALRLDDQELVSDVLKAQTRLSRRYRRPRC